MIQSILIANRGEIASRIIRTCKKLGIQAVVVYAQSDAQLPFVLEADTAINIGGNTAAQSYLDQDKIIAAAHSLSVDAIHPGFGFLSENGDFATRCQKEGFIFIGPKPDAMHKMGLKSEAKNIMEQYNVPTIKGYQGSNQAIDFLIEQGNKIGFPLLIKAVAGGGGKGMRIAYQSSELKTAIEAAKSEGLNSFGNADVILERYFENARHVEFQIFGDSHGNIIHLLERECSIQRRYQKVLEESPSPVLSDELREKMGAAAVLAAKAIHYENAGTVEFILAENGDFFFLEMNTRLQVEHPVTEMITGLDLVEWQILVAEGKPLPLQQKDIKGQGYALEFRVYAEDAANNFFPATGKVLSWKTPNTKGLRVESGIESGSDVGVFFDPMLAKIIVHDADRATAFRKMNYVLKNTECIGLTTNIPFLQQLTTIEAIQKGNYSTAFIGEHFDFEAFANEQKKGATIATIAAFLFDWNKREQQRTLVKNITSGWRSNFYKPQEVTFAIEEETYVLQYTYLGDNSFTVLVNTQELAIKILAINDATISLAVANRSYKCAVYSNNGITYVHSPAFGQKTIHPISKFPIITKEKEKGNYTAPMPSEVLKVHVEKGQTIKEGDLLITLLSMKMENAVEAHQDGTVEEVFVAMGESIEKGTELLAINATIA